MDGQWNNHRNARNWGEEVIYGYNNPCHYWTATYVSFLLFFTPLMHNQRYLKGLLTLQSICVLRLIQIFSSIYKPRLVLFCLLLNNAIWKCNCLSSTIFCQLECLIGGTQCYRGWVVPSYETTSQYCYIRTQQFESTGKLFWMGRGPHSPLHYKPYFPYEENKSAIPNSIRQGIFW